MDAEQYAPAEMDQQQIPEAEQYEQPDMGYDQ